MEEDQGEDDQREDEEEVDEMEDHETEDGEMEDDQSEDGQPEVRELSKLSFAWPSRVGLGQWMPSGWTWLREA